MFSAFSLPCLPPLFLREDNIAQGAIKINLLVDKLKVKIKTDGELPTYKTVEEEIREFRKQKQFTKANFDPASFPDKVFCMTLKKPVIQAELAQELIDNSNGNYGKLLNATREMLKANYLNDEAQQTLKQELLKRYSEWLDKQFEEKNTLSE